MKGLAEVSSQHAVVSITGRVARNSYATESAKPFDSTEHPATRRYVSHMTLNCTRPCPADFTPRFWSASNDRYEVNTFDWFVKKVRIIPKIDDIGVSKGALSGR